MILIRRLFYLIVGLTFPGFWVVHASGSYGAELYRPLQHLFRTSASGWPSLITATLLYLAAILLFEVCYRLLKHTHP